MQTKLTEVERAGKELASVQKKRADIADKLAAKAKHLRAYEERQLHDDEKARRKVAEEQRRLIREREVYERRLRTDLSGRMPHIPVLSSRSVPVEEVYDSLISHASEDKDGFVRELAQALQDRGARL